jgi:hypothetical protein
MLYWNVELLPYGSPAPKEIPKADLDDPWSFARNVRAAYVRVPETEGIGRHAEAEHYLFYRGLARFALPVGFTAETGGRGTFQNTSAHLIPFAAVLEITDEGGRFTEIGAVEGGAVAAFSLQGARPQKDLARFAGAVGARVLDALVARGLYVDEARAMIATWSRSWFQSKGHRVVYLLPRAEVDKVLPLSINPEPQELVRVLVGRLEYVPPELESRVDRALAALTGSDVAAREDGRAVLAGLDRFLEPHVRRALAASADPAVLAGAQQVLAELVRQE